MGRRKKHQSHVVAVHIAGDSHIQWHFTDNVDELIATLEKENRLLKVSKLGVHTAQEIMDSHTQKQLETYYKKGLDAKKT